MFSKSQRCYLFNVVLETGPEEMVRAPSSIHHGRKKKKESQREKEMLTLNLFMLSSAPHTGLSTEPSSTKQHETNLGRELEREQE